MKAFISRKAYAAILFDCDGTLTDSMPVHYLAWHRTLAQYGIEFPESRFYELAGVPTDRIIELLAGEQRIAVDAGLVAAEKEQAFLQQIHLLKPIDVVLDVAEHFRGRLPMAVASGGVRDVIVQQLERIGCADWFDAIVTAEDTKRHKPFPDVFLEAARRLAVEPTQCLVYEDADLGLEAARAAGMDAIDVRENYRSRPA
jgi:HAD superfamily hydrolase (TIGR01509 family)